MLAPMLAYVLKNTSRAALVAYGVWALLSLALSAGTLTSLHQVEHTGREAVLARAEAGATAVELTLQRVFEAVANLQALAQTRLRFVDTANMAGIQAIDEELTASLSPSRNAVQAMSIYHHGRLAWAHGDVASAPPSGHDVTAGQAGGLSLSKPALDPVTRRWSMRVGLTLRDRTGRTEGWAAVQLDPLALSDLIARQTAGDGVVSMVQLRSDGSFIARSHHPGRALLEHPSPIDPAFAAALRTGSGQVEDMQGGVNRLIGFRAPDAVPIVVSQSIDIRLVRAGFYRLRRILLAVSLALIAGGFSATRLILANYLLRARLGEQAMLDPLTGLHNRRYFTDVLSSRFAAAQRQGLSASVLQIDLDGFKQVNDTRGHPVGDALLRQVAARLRACVGPGDAVVRLGGDEFAIIRLGRQQRRDSLALARFVVSELAHPYQVETYQLRISASVGVALYPSGGEHLPDLLRSADIALYFVKDEGGDAYRVFDPAMEQSVRTRRALEIDLRLAIPRGEMEVYFQPLVQLEPRRVGGFEALVRWHHPELGMVMPSTFIPLAEETGQIAAIGEWVLRQACLEATRWDGNLRIAVNLSPVQFERSDIVDIVASALRDTRLPPSRLELEITEGVVMGETGDVLETMRRLQALGVRLALDDFGTGYSSLSYLRSFPFDKVKIDASFLADLHGDGGTIIRAVLGLCGHLGLDTLVEGVETQAQLQWLLVEGCTEVQGHLFSPPRPAAGLAEIIARVGAPAARRLVRS